MCCDPDELLEQSTGSVQYSYCQPYILCYVHYLHHHSISHTFPGELHPAHCVEHATAEMCPVFKPNALLLLIPAAESDVGLCCVHMQEVQSPRQATTEVCGFVTIVIGTFLLHSTKDLDITLAGLNAATKSTFSAASLSELQMQRLPLTSNGALDSPAPTGHRMTNSDRF